MAIEINQRLESTKSYIQTSFQFFYEKKPISKNKRTCRCFVEIETIACLTTSTTETILNIQVPVKVYAHVAKQFEFGA